MCYCSTNTSVFQTSPLSFERQMNDLHSKRLNPIIISHFVVSIRYHNTILVLRAGRPFVPPTSQPALHCKKHSPQLISSITTKNKTKPASPIATMIHTAKVNTISKHLSFLLFINNSSAAYKSLFIIQNERLIEVTLPDRIDSA